MEPYFLNHFISPVILELSSIDLIEAGFPMTRPKQPIPTENRKQEII